MRSIFCLFLAFFAAQVCSAQLKVQKLLTENLSNPLCIDAAVPRFGWQLTEADKQNVLQTAYEIKVTTKGLTGKNNETVWNSGKVTSDQSLYVPYAGSPLQSGQRYYWQVRVWDNYGKSSPWSEANWWQMGLLHADDWAAKWITPGFKDAMDEASPIFRKTFTVSKNVR